MEFTHFKPADGGPAALLPSGVDHTQLIDITQLQQPFRVFMDPNTGTVHDGNVYHRQQQLAQEITP